VCLGYSNLNDELSDPITNRSASIQNAPEDFIELRFPRGVFQIIIKVRVYDGIA